MSLIQFAGAKVHKISILFHSGTPKLLFDKKRGMHDHIFHSKRLVTHNWNVTG